MSELTKKIAKQSKIVMIMAEVARIILYVMLGLTIAAFVSSFFDANQPAFYVFGKPVLFMQLTNGQTVEQARVQYVETMVQIGLALALLFMVSALFARIRDSETPFTTNIVKRMKAIGVMLGIVIFVDNGYLGVVVAFIIYAFAMIFEYGGELQHQVDETL